MQHEYLKNHILKSKKNRKRVIIVVGSILAIIIANLILSSVIESKITELLSNNESDYYNISVGKPNFKGIVLYFKSYEV